MMTKLTALDLEAGDLIAQLRNRKVSIDDGPDGRGGWYSHDEPDPLCSKAADMLAYRKTITPQAGQALGHLSQLLYEVRRVYAAAESAGVDMQIGHYRRLTEGVDCLSRLQDLIGVE